ncbi:unnamed protein product [Mesocestoides corti]|uniref:Uncharacterized protein n=1 Tax=Mesocestoides corti TaxID=53468 RepID=A0A158QVR5_MESCO|nr:unnamed protein product [Mesocestoides corti]
MVSRFLNDGEMEYLTESSVDMAESDSCVSEMNPRPAQMCTVGEDEIPVFVEDSFNAKVGNNPDQQEHKHYSPLTPKPKGDDSIELLPPRRYSLPGIAEEGTMMPGNTAKGYLLLRQKCSAQKKELIKLRDKLRAANENCVELVQAKERLQAELIASEKARSHQATLLSRTIVDKEVIQSEAKACEQELADVEEKIKELSQDIHAKETRIAELEGNLSRTTIEPIAATIKYRFFVFKDELLNCRDALEKSEAKMDDLGASFEDFLREREERLLAKLQATNDEAEAEKRRLMNELESLRLSHEEDVRVRTRKEIARQEADARTILQLQRDLAQLKEQLEAQNGEMSNMKDQNEKLMEERNSLQNTTQETRTLLAKFESDAAKERSKSEKLEAELIASRIALANSERAAHELSLERDIALEKNESSAKRFEAMHAEIAELKAIIQNSNQKISVLEENNREFEKRNASLQKRLKQAEEEKDEAEVETKRLEDKMTTIKKEKHDLETTLKEMRARMADLEHKNMSVDGEVKELQLCLARTEKEREANQAALVEGLRMVGIPTAECRETAAPVTHRKSDEKNPDQGGRSRWKRGGYVLNFAKAAQSFLNKIMSLESENSKLQSRLMTQDAHLSDQRAQATCLNDTLLKLEEHLRRAREENKQISLECTKVKKQLESHKLALSKYRDAKHALQEKLARREEMLKHASTGPKNDVEFDKYAKLTVNFEKARSVIQELNSRQKLLKDQLDEAKAVLAKYDVDYRGPSEVCNVPQPRQQTKEPEPKKRSTSLFAKKASAIVTESLDSEGHLCAESFRTHLRKALNVSNLRSPDRSHQEHDPQPRERSTVPRYNGDGADNYQ